MRISQDWLLSNQSPRVVIIGSGPAGISLALALADHRVGSVILEAGPITYSDDSQDFYKGTVIGDPYFDLDIARLRYFGGTSNHWVGWCRPLDEQDFLEREDIEHMGWPIRKSDLNPYVSRASQILELEKGSDQPELASAAQYTQDTPVNEDISRIAFQYSPPVRFSEKYAKLIEKSKFIHLCTDAAVETIRAAQGAVNEIVIRGPQGGRLVIKPEYLVLCAGGIENSRILLWSNSVSGDRVVPMAKTLGRFWMEHPETTAGSAQLSGNLWSELKLQRKIIFFSPTFSTMKRFRILNGNLRLHSAAEESESVYRSAACAVPTVGSKLLSILGRRPCDNTIVMMSWEQAPSWENRVTLSKERDKYGVPRVALHWKKSELDYRTSRVIFELVSKYLVGSALGAIRANNYVIDMRGYPADGEVAGNHHMGGTRMASNGKGGVVDRNLKIFGMKNIYVLGSSVFPTGGHANPTFTIVQLALRLGDHLAHVVP